MSAAENLQVICTGVASLLLIVTLGVDLLANQCDQRHSKDIMLKQNAATQAMFQFISLWSQQFIVEKPVDPGHGSFSEVAKFTAECAQEAHNALIASLNSTECNRYDRARSILLIVAFIVQSLGMVAPMLLADWLARLK